MRALSTIRARRPAGNPVPAARVFTCLACLFALSARAAIGPADFPRRRDVTPPPHTAFRPGAPAAAELDEPALAATDDGYANLRLYDATGTEIPCVVRPRRHIETATREYPIGFAQESFRLLPDNQLEFVLRCTNAADRPIAIAFETPLDNFEKQVTVDAAPDGATWTALAAAQPIYDYARFMAVRRLRIALPATPHPWLRVRIDNISAAEPSPLTQLDRDRRGGVTFSEVERASFRRQDFRIDRVRLIGQTVVAVGHPPVLRAYTPANVAVRDDRERRRTTVTFDIGRAPVVAIALEITTPNFDRPIAVSGRGAGDADWVPVASGRLVRDHTAPADRAILAVATPPAPRFDTLRLTIDNADSPPLVLDRVTVRGEIHDLVFFATAAAGYALHYGGRDIPPPRYDVADALRAAAVDTPAGTLAAESPNPAYRPGGGWWNSRRFLMLGVLAAAMGLIWALVGASRKLGPPAAD